MGNQVNEAKSLPLFRKIGYGVGDAGSNFCWTFVASFIMLYCTNVLGVSSAVIGTIMMLSKFLDGVTDVVMGHIIDSTHHKMGKARFWYFVSCLPVAVSTFLLFNVPASFTEQTKYIYIFIVYTLMGAVFYTMNNIAYASLTALITKNPKDRVQMGSYRFLFAIAALLFISSATSGLVESFGGGQQGWRMVSLVYSIICYVLLMVPVFAVKELPESDLKDLQGSSKAKEEEPGFLESMKLLFKNKYFFMILLIYMVNYLSSGITQGMGIFFATYQLNNAAQFGTISMAGMLPIIVALPFVPQLVGKLGIRKSVIAGNAVALIGSLLLVAGGLTGGFGLVLIGLAVKAIGTSPLTGSLNAIIAETDDYSQLKFGRRITGTIFSCSSVGLKVGTGLGTALCGFLLELGKFDGMATTQLPCAIATINWSYLLANALPPVLLIVIFSFLNVEEVNRKLRAK